MSDTETPVEKKVGEKIDETAEVNKAEKVETEKEEKKEEEKQEKAEKQEIGEDTSVEKRPAVGDEKSKKRRKRRQYDDLPKEEPESDDDDDDAKDDNPLEHEWEEDEEEDLVEIDESNIITGRRTRGKVIDFKKAAENLKKENKEVNSEDEEDWDEPKE